MKKKTCIDRYINQYNVKIFSFVYGFLSCLLVLVVVYSVYRYHQKNASQLIGGWVMPKEDFSEDRPTAPISLNFYNDGRVDIVTSNEDNISCSYTVGKEPWDRTIVIHNFYRDEVELQYTIQPQIYISGLGDYEGVWDGRYKVETLSSKHQPEKRRTKASPLKAGEIEVAQKL